MKFRLLTLAALGAAALSAPPAPAADKVDLERLAPVPEGQPVPVQDFFRPRLFRDPRLNPAGTHIAALVTKGDDQYSLLVYDIGKRGIETLSGVGDKDIFGVTWLTDKRLMFSLSTQKYYNAGLFATEVGNMARAYPLVQYAGARVIAVPAAAPEYPLVWLSFDALESGHDLGPATLNTNTRTGAFIDLNTAAAANDDFITVRDTNERHVLKSLPGLDAKGRMTSGYLADKAGNLAFGFSSAAGYTTLHYLEGGGWKKSPLDLENVDVMAAGNQPEDLIVLDTGTGDKPRALQLVNAKTGQAGITLLQDKAYDFDGYFYRDPATRDVVGAMYDRSGPATVWFTEDYRGLQKLLDGYFPGLVVRLLGSDRQQRIFLVTTSSDRQPAIYYSVDLEKKVVSLVKNSAPWIDPKRMRPMSILKYKTRDGRSLDAYVTLPAGATKEAPPPLVVLPHGGPWVRDTWGYDAEAQFLASRGYAVMQPNYRGSPGYGWMFPADDEWDFRKMHDDVTDATNTLVKSGLIDRNRIAIMGGSFGGYLAVSGVVNEPGLYRCAVTIAGVFDWSEMLRDEKYYEFYSPWYARMLRKLGDPAKARDKFDRISPIKGIGNIKVPVFVSHGKDDVVVSINQSKMLISELKAHGVPYEAFLVGGESHGMAHVANEVDLYTRIEAFLARNLMAATPPAAR